MIAGHVICDRLDQRKRLIGVEDLIQVVTGLSDGHHHKLWLRRFKFATLPQHIHHTRGVGHNVDRQFIGGDVDGLYREIQGKGMVVL